jgi:hypothetical protein
MWDIWGLSGCRCCGKDNAGAAGNAIVVFKRFYACGADIYGTMMGMLGLFPFERTIGCHHFDVFIHCVPFMLQKLRNGGAKTIV